MAAAVDVPFGDVDCSSTVNAVDALKIQRYVAGFPQPQGEGPCPFWGLGESFLVSDIPLIWGDADCSGGVNAVDALKTFRHLAALSFLQDVPCPDMGAIVQVDASQ